MTQRKTDDPQALWAELQTLRAELEECHARLATAERLNQQLVDRQINSGALSYDRLSTKVIALEARLMDSEAVRDYLRDQLRRQEATIAQLNARLAAQTSAPAVRQPDPELTAQLTQARELAARLQAESDRAAADHEAAVAQLSAQLSEANAQVVRLEADWRAAQARQAEAEGVMAESASTLSELNNRLIEAHTQTAQVEEALREHQSRLADGERQIIEQRMTISELHTQLDETRTRQTELEHLVAGYDATVTQLTSQLSQARTTIAERQAELEAAQARPVEAAPPEPLRVVEAADTGPRLNAGAQTPLAAEPAANPPASDEGAGPAHPAGDAHLNDLSHDEAWSPAAPTLAAPEGDPPLTGDVPPPTRPAPSKTKGRRRRH